MANRILGHPIRHPLRGVAVQAVGDYYGIYLEEVYALVGTTPWVAADYPDTGLVHVSITGGGAGGGGADSSGGFYTSAGSGGGGGGTIELFLTLEAGGSIDPGDTINLLVGGGGAGGAPGADGGDGEASWWGNDYSGGKGWRGVSGGIASSTAPMQLGKVGGLGGSNLYGGGGGIGSVSQYSEGGNGERSFMNVIVDPTPSGWACGGRGGSSRWGGGYSQTDIIQTGSIGFGGNGGSTPPIENQVGPWGQGGSGAAAGDGAASPVAGGAGDQGGILIRHYKLVPPA